MLAVALSARTVRPTLRERDEATEHVVEEEAEPDALAAALPPDAVHAVVPVSRTHEREPVRAHRQRAIERAAAVGIQVGHLLRWRRQQVGLVLARGERARRDEGDALVQHAPVARRADIEGGHVGEPEEVVREVRAGATAARRMPPVEHVALRELVRGVQEELGARELRPRVDERGGVLELVAEAEGTARLVESGAPPEPAADVLVEEPAVHHHVERGRRRLHLHGRERLPPARADRRERLVDSAGLPVARDERARRVRAGRLAQEERALDGFAGTDRDRDLERGAGVEAGARPAVERALVAQGRRLGR